MAVVISEHTPYYAMYKARVQAMAWPISAKTAQKETAILETLHRDKLKSTINLSFGIQRQCGALNTSCTCHGEMF
jgi:hypothetical protein